MVRRARSGCRQAVRRLVLHEGESDEGRRSVHTWEQAPVATAKGTLVSRMTNRSCTFTHAIARLSACHDVFDAPGGLRSPPSARYILECANGAGTVAV